MTSADYLKERGFKVSLVENRIRVSPGSMISETDRKYIMLHRLELIAELAANDGIERRLSWRVTLHGKPIATIVGNPMTKQEALKSIRFRWNEADVIDAHIQNPKCAANTLELKSD